MANSLYDKGRESFLSQNPALDWDTDTIKLMLVKVAQAFSNAHQYHSDITAGNIVATSSALAGKTVAAGVADANDVVFTAPASGHSCNLILFKDTGVSSTSPLIAFIDTGTGLPVTTNGGDITVSWDNTNKIFKL
jgi:hypothetical protein